MSNEVEVNYFAQLNEEGIVLNIITGNPRGRFDDSIVWYPCNKDTKIGDVYLGSDFINKDFTLEEQKEVLLKNLNIIYRNQMYRIMSEYDMYEMLTWFIQIIEAQEVRFGNLDNAIFLNEISEKRDIPIGIIAERVLGHNKVFRKYAGNITGSRQRLEDEVKVCMNLADLQNVKRRIQLWQTTGALK